MSFLMLMGIFMGICGILSGCKTAFLATDNKVLLYLPFTERKSDQIAGVLRPWERAKLIHEKGEKGQKASYEEKRILVEQLAAEYDRSASPNIRRSSIEALDKIVSNAEIPEAIPVFDRALTDPVLDVRIAACNAFGNYCLAKKSSGNRPLQRKTAAERLCAEYSHLPYSMEAGSQEENNEKKDMRLAIIRNLGQFDINDSPEILPTLQLALLGEKLDDGALQTAAMISLERTTGKKYGLNSQVWEEYLAFAQGSSEICPKELSLLQQIPAPDLPMLK